MLSSDDPHPVIAYNAGGDGPVLITCEHAGRETPSALGDMGVPATDWGRHIAWDIGALDLARAVSDRLDARLIAQRYSRLVIDCNRAHISPELVPTASDGTAIPANADLSDADRTARIAAIHTPFHDRIAAEIERQRPALIFAVHSFTPHMNGADRPWHAGFLANRMPEAAEAMVRISAGRAPYFRFALNEPYTVDDVSDYTLPVHGEQNGIPHALVEIRNDQLASDAGIEFWADHLAGVLTEWLRSRDT
ncbi:N-formylglutamate amidohydrolase [Minwuia sp.]|uniref:N-formylglutamate amidohydrolase n=1 Tax=Minwuia sp. TaxID=2493630 RepID=UPI003A8FE9D9